MLENQLQNFRAEVRDLLARPNAKRSEQANSVIEIQMKGLTYRPTLDIFKNIYRLASQFNRNLPEGVFLKYVECYLAYTQGFDPLFYHTLWVDVDEVNGDALVYQVGNSDSIGFLFESIMWGLNIYVSPEFLKQSIANMAKIGMQSSTPVVSSPFHVVPCGDEETDTQAYHDFMLVRDFPYACFNFDGHYLSYDDYLGSLKSKRRNALVTATRHDYHWESLDSQVMYAGSVIFEMAAKLMRERYESFADYRHAIGQLMYATTPWDKKCATDEFVGVAIVQRIQKEDGDWDIVSVTIAHLSEKYPSKIISHTSKVGVKDVGASAIANLLKYITDANQTDALGFKVNNLNVCCETYVGVNLTGSYTQYLRHACNAESYETFDFISVVDKDLSTTLKPPFFNAIENTWVH